MRDIGEIIGNIIANIMMYFGIISLIFMFYILIGKENLKKIFQNLIFILAIIIFLIMMILAGI